MTFSPLINFITMKKILILLFSLYSCLSFAVKTEDMYLMRNIELGNLFFIFENSFQSADNKNPLLFDMTHLSSCDTVSIKMTLTNKTLVDVDSVKLSWNEGSYTVINPILIYKEKDNKCWVNRCDCIFPYIFVEQAFTHQQCPTFTIYTTAHTISYSLSQNKWDKLKLHFQEIFITIQSHKRLTSRK